MPGEATEEIDWSAVDVRRDSGMAPWKAKGTGEAFLNGLPSEGGDPCGISVERAIAVITSDSGDYPPLDLPPLPDMSR